jgi:hypothetical protein
LLRTDIRREKAMIMGEVMQLDAEQAATFWPIYKEFEIELSSIGDQILSLVKGYAANYNNMTAMVADQLADKLGLRRRRIKQSVTGLLWEEYPARELDCSQSPFFIGALCPRISMAPGRRLNIGEAPVALP